MGKAAALANIQRGGKVMLVSRSSEKLAKAKDEILSVLQKLLRTTINNNHEDDTNTMLLEGLISTAVLDVSNEDSVEQFGASLTEGLWDGLVFSAAGKAPHGPITELETSQTMELFETKFWGAYRCAKHIAPRLNNDGAVVFVSGVLNRRPGVNCSPLACTNGALEGLTRSLALEFGPRLRVNCLSPGFCDTERFDGMDSDKRVAMLRNTAESLPLRRVGSPEDMGEALHYLLTSRFCTGVVLDCDGGHGIRQYASAATDPMRK